MKITREKLKQLIMEEVAGGFMPTNYGRIDFMGGGNKSHDRVYTSGEPPNNQNKDMFIGRPPYETLGVETHIEEGEIYLTIGKNQYKLIFEDEDLSRGIVTPIGEYKFNISDQNKIEWISDNTPVQVKFDSGLEKQILEFAGRGENVD